MKNKQFLGLLVSLASYSAYAADNNPYEPIPVTINGNTYDQMTWTESIPAESLTIRRTVTLVCRGDENNPLGLVGSVTCDMVKAPGEHSGVMHTLNVNPAFANKGISQYLFERAQDFCLETRENREDFITMSLAPTFDETLRQDAEMKYERAVDNGTETREAAHRKFMKPVENLERELNDLYHYNTYLAPMDNPTHRACRIPTLKQSQRLRQEKEAQEAYEKQERFQQGVLAKLAACGEAHAKKVEARNQKNRRLFGAALTVASVGAASAKLLYDNREAIGSALMAVTKLQVPNAQ